MRWLNPFYLVSKLSTAAGNTMRAGTKVLAIMAAILAALAFILWNADVWVLRDKWEHFKSAAFGTYVEPECRADPSACREGKKIEPPKSPVRRDICGDHPGLELHCQFQTLYDYFNVELFQNRLPPAVITLQRKKGAAGYFAHRRFKRPDGRTIDEIALNPSTFGRVSMLRLASTLVHEMVHLEQAHFGKPGRGGFHNAEWGRLMRRVGLHPSATGRPGGRMVGRRMTHYIVPGGKFERIAKAHPLIGSRKVSLME